MASIPVPDFSFVSTAGAQLGQAFEGIGEAIDIKATKQDVLDAHTQMLDTTIQELKDVGLDDATAKRTAYQYMLKPTATELKSVDTYIANKQKARERLLEEVINPQKQAGTESQLATRAGELTAPTPGQPAQEMETPVTTIAGGPEGPIGDVDVGGQFTLPPTEETPGLRGVPLISELMKVEGATLKQASALAKEATTQDKLQLEQDKEDRRSRAIDERRLMFDQNRIDRQNRFNEMQDLNQQRLEIANDKTTKQILKSKFDHVAGTWKRFDTRINNLQKQLNKDFVLNEESIRDQLELAMKQQEALTALQQSPSWDEIVNLNQIAQITQQLEGIVQGSPFIDVQQAVNQVIGGGQQPTGLGTQSRRPPAQRRRGGGF